MLIANRDVTDEKMRELKQEEELREAKLKAECANKAKSSFLYNMSHDIRTPMNAIIGYADLASRHLKETDKLGRYLEEIQICGKELLSMLGNVLDIARIENNKVEMEYTVSNIHKDHLVITGIRFFNHVNACNTIICGLNNTAFFLQ